MTDDDWRKALKTGVCIQGCDISKKTCRHLNHYIERGDKSSYIMYLADLELAMSTWRQLKEHKTSFADHIKPDTLTTTQFENQLKAFGLLPHEILVITERFYHRHTLHQIYKQHGFVNLVMVWRIQQKAIDKLRERDFKWKPADE